MLGKAGEYSFVQEASQQAFAMGNQFVGARNTDDTSTLQRAGVEQYIKMADSLGLKENKKVRLVNMMTQKDFEKELMQKEMQQKLSGLQSLRRRELSAISKRFVGGRVHKLTAGHPARFLTSPLPTHCPPPPDTS